MTVRAILQAPNALLRRRSALVTRFDERLGELATDLAETCVAARCVGIAAPQIGTAQRVFVMHEGPGLEDSWDLELLAHRELSTMIASKKAYCNPEILERSGSQAFEEACASLRGRRVKVTRSTMVRIRYQDERGMVREETLQGLKARCVEHEIDHLDGILMTDRAGGTAEREPEADREARVVSDPAHDVLAATSALRSVFAETGAPKDIVWLRDVEELCQRTEFGMSCPAWDRWLHGHNQLARADETFRRTIGARLDLLTAHLGTAEDHANPIVAIAEARAAVSSWPGAYVPDPRTTREPRLAAAHAAGLFALGVLPRVAYAVPKPRVITDHGALHDAKEPAVLFKNGGRAYWFWRGVHVDERVVLRPDTITLADIEAEKNQARRAVLVERFGAKRYVEESGAVILDHDPRFGTLLQKPIVRRQAWEQGGTNDAVVVVKVKNSTPEPDGSYRDYYLRVPPSCRTAREAVAWTFGRSPDEYDPGVET